MANERKPRAGESKIKLVVMIAMNLLKMISQFIKKEMLQFILRRNDSAGGSRQQIINQDVEEVEKLRLPSSVYLVKSNFQFFGPS